MANKQELSEQIVEAECEIAAMEQKRLRSQAALLEAMLDKREPDPRDAEYFKTISAIIKLEREKLKMLKEELRLSE